MRAMGDAPGAEFIQVSQILIPAWHPAVRFYPIRTSSPSLRGRVALSDSGSHPNTPRHLETPRPPEAQTYPESWIAVPRPEDDEAV